ncbi:MAG: exosortase/archaeosortase family protein [Candidatus Dormibacteraeota bacterium]|uniref:Exosortase/archaeosortase family protein n=1 Tax=Candidatus Amunia macphersoniae TaxID=3127014 RepID=A0A934KN77_9BACT|nr:exosortase/archaeosortase family protein [Candidatus Dormibacteraeota bacterium]
MKRGSFDLTGLRERGSQSAASFAIWARAHRVLWPAAGIVLVALIGYNLTLGSMADYLRLETPLAYLPLLPFFSIGIALFTAHRYRNAPAPIRDRQIDFLIGIPLIIFALVLITIVPALASTYYWSNRPDVLSLALFVTGLITIFYGTTWMWRVKASLVFLVLMWPALYLNIMPGIMQSFTDTTNSALGAVVAHLSLGVTPTGSPGILAVHQASGIPLTVSVGSACSGADSVLGFLLIGGAILTAVGGGGLRKVSWMVVGLVLTFLVNVLRLTSILGLASAGHPDLALGGYHAVIGLILFTVVVALMMRLLPLFGLQPRADVVASPTSRRTAGAAARPLPSVRRRQVVVGAMATLAVLVGLTDHALGPYAAFQDGTGSPRVQPFSMASAPAGWRISYEADYPWATQYFGANSSFTRFLVQGAPKPAATPQSGQPATTAVSQSIVYADVVRTDDRGSLDAYNLQNCFLFHNYNIVASQRVDVGNGVTALLLNYTDPATQASWATVSWAWPVENKGTTYYERVALTSSLFTAGDADVSPNAGLHGMVVGFLNLLNGSHDDPKTNALYKNADTSLQGEAADLVRFAVNRH